METMQKVQKHQELAKSQNRSLRIHHIIGLKNIRQLKDLVHVNGVVRMPTIIMMTLITFVLPICLIWLI